MNSEIEYDNEILFDSIIVLNYLILALYLFFFVFVLAKLKCKMELVSLLSSLSFLVSFLIRCINFTVILLGEY